MEADHKRRAGLMHRCGVDSDVTATNDPAIVGNSKMTKKDKGEWRGGDALRRLNVTPAGFQKCIMYLDNHGFLSATILDVGNKSIVS
jgi:hypothetical protein